MYHFIGGYKDCTGYKSLNNFATWRIIYISTQLYAVPGKMVTVTIPPDQAGKVELMINIHTDDLVKGKNRENWLKGKSPYYKRPGLIWSDYTGGSNRIGSNTTINMMSPYGGAIYVVLKNNASFEFTVDGAIEMPYFIQG